MFYDGGCPRCSRGVRQYQRLDWARRIAWVDITQEPDVLEPYGIDFANAMEQLHVLDRDGQVRRGVYAFAAVWSDLPYYRFIAKCIRMVGALPLLDWGYRRLTRGRFERRCREGICSAPNAE